MYKSIHYIILITSLSLFMVGCIIFKNSKKKEHMNFSNHSKYDLIGENFTISYLSDPFISQGKFRLANHDTTTIKVLIKSVQLKAENHLQELNGIFVFDFNQEKMLDLEEIFVPPMDSLNFSVGFARINYEIQLGASVIIDLVVEVNGIELQAISTIKFVRRIPRRH